MKRDRVAACALLRWREAAASALSLVGGQDGAPYFQSFEQWPGCRLECGELRAGQGFGIREVYGTRIQVNPVAAVFVVEMRCGGESCRPDEPDDFALPDAAAIAGIGRKA